MERSIMHMTNPFTDGREEDSIYWCQKMAKTLHPGLMTTKIDKI